METNNVSAQSSALNFCAANPPRIPSSRGPLRQNGMRSAGGPPRSTPRRCRVYGGSVSKKVSDEQSDCRQPHVFLTPASYKDFRAEQTANCGALSGIKPASDCRHDDDDSLPSALPPPKPHPAANSVTNLECVKTVAPLKQNAELINVNNVLLHDMGKTQTFYGTRDNETNSEISVEPARGAKHAQPVLVLQLSLKSFLRDVDALMSVLKNNLDLACCREFLIKTEGIHNDMQNEISELFLKDAEVNKELHEAKACQVASLDSDKPQQASGGSGQRAVLGSSEAKNKNEAISEGGAKGDYDGEKGSEWSAEMEAWRIEKGNLLAEKALLLQKRVELQHHLRRGTNIKNISSLVASRASSQTRKKNANESDSDSTPGVNDLEIVKLRLELKEAKTRLSRLHLSYDAAEEAKRAHRSEIESETATLRSELAATKKENNARCVALKEALKRAELLRETCCEVGDNSLLLLLERRINRALAVLKKSSRKAASDDFDRLSLNFSRSSSVASALRRPSLSSASVSMSMSSVSRPALHFLSS